jgi:hypothetical protein
MLCDVIDGIPNYCLDVTLRKQTIFRGTSSPTSVDASLADHELP